ncbi:MAG: D-glycero-beta-D-manno-heptose 1,7-bisphosphate 7-phosphatase [Nitrospirales bacterium]
MNGVLEGITVFVDRDGTLNDDPGYLTDPDGLILFPGVVEAVARLKQAGSRVVLVTNQSAVGRKYMTVDELTVIHDRLEKFLEDGGGSLDGIFFCPHHPDERCACRKPKPGLIQQAVHALDIQVSRSYMVGDKLSDLELAQAVGAIGVLVSTTSQSQTAIDAQNQGLIEIECTTLNFSDAVDWILRDALTRNWPNEKR